MCEIEEQPSEPTTTTPETIVRTLGTVVRTLGPVVPPKTETTATMVPQDLCHPNPCQNGGTCTQEGGRVSCSCPDGTGGDLCHKLETTTTGFQTPETTTVLTSPLVQLNTTSLLRTTTPEKEVSSKRSDPCDTFSPCQNGATCYLDENTSELACVCPMGFSGVFCQDIVQFEVTEDLETNTSPVPITHSVDITTEEMYEITSGDKVTPSQSPDFITELSTHIQTTRLTSEVSEQTSSGQFSGAPDGSGDTDEIESTPEATEAGVWETTFSGESTVSTNPCESYNPCQNGATCYLDRTTREIACSCTTGFSGVFCQDIVEGEVSKTSTLETDTPTVSMDITTEETTSGDIMTSALPKDIDTASGSDAMTTTTRTDGLVPTRTGDAMLTSTGSGDTRETVTIDISTTASTTTHMDETRLWDATSSEKPTEPTGACDDYNPCQNGATCDLDGNSGEVACNCAAGFTGVFCQDTVDMTTDDITMPTLPPHISTESTTDILGTTAADGMIQTGSGDLSSAAAGSGDSEETMSGYISTILTTTTTTDMPETSPWDAVSSGESTLSTDPCDRYNPCQNGATCYQDEDTGEVACNCAAGFSGVFCQNTVEEEVTETSTFKTSTSTDSTAIASTEFTSGDMMTTTAPGDTKIMSSTDALTAAAVTDDLVQVGSGDPFPTTTDSTDTGRTLSFDGSTTAAITTQVEEISVWEETSSGDATVSSDPCDRFNPCQNGASCYLDVSSGEVACICAMGFSGVFCQETVDTATKATEISSFELTSSAMPVTDRATDVISETASGDMISSTLSADIDTEKSTNVPSATTLTDTSDTTGSGDALSVPPVSEETGSAAIETISTTVTTVPTDACDRYNPCQNGATCYLDETTGEVACNCAAGFTGVLCQNVIETTSSDSTIPSFPPNISTESITDTLRTTFPDVPIQTDSGDFSSTTSDSTDMLETMSGDTSTTADTTHMTETGIWDAASSGDSTDSTDPCVRYNPCQHGATCYQNENTGEVACSCSVGFSGVFCQNAIEGEETDTSKFKTNTSTVSVTDSVYVASTEDTYEPASGDIMTTTSSGDTQTTLTTDVMKTSATAGGDLSPTMDSEGTGRTVSLLSSTTALATHVDETSVFEETSSGEATVSTDPCDRYNPCQNGATCYLDESSGEVACNCAVGFSGVLCQDTVDTVTEVTKASTFETSPSVLSSTAASTDAISETGSGDLMTSTLSRDIRTESSTSILQTTTGTDRLDQTSSGDFVSLTAGSGYTDETETTETTTTATTLFADSGIGDTTSSMESTESTDPCEQYNPCQNGATCYRDQNSGEVACSCAAGFTGVFCQIIVEMTSGGITEPTLSPTIRAESTTRVLGTTAAEVLTQTGSDDRSSPATGSGDIQDTMSGDMSTTGATKHTDETSALDITSPGMFTMSTDPCDRYNPCRNGATCFLDANTGEVACSCAMGFSGALCQDIAGTVTEGSMLETSPTADPVTDSESIYATEDLSETASGDVITPILPAAISTGSSTILPMITLTDRLDQSGSGDALPTTTGSGDTDITVSEEISTTAVVDTSVLERSPSREAVTEAVDITSTGAVSETASGDTITPTFFTDAARTDVLETGSGDVSLTAISSGDSEETLSGGISTATTTTQTTSEVTSNPCDRFNPCQNGATCYLDQNTGEVACACPAGFSGVFCKNIVESEENETSTLETSTPSMSVTDSLNVTVTDRVSVARRDGVTVPDLSSSLSTESSTDALETTVTSDLSSSTAGSGDVISGDMATTTATTTTEFDETSLWDATFSGEFTVSTDLCDRYNPCQNGATCYSDQNTGEVACRCSEGFSGVLCQDTVDTQTTTLKASTSTFYALDASSSGESAVSTHPCDRYNPCQNGATCFLNETTTEVACSCAVGFSGVFCQKTVEADMNETRTTTTSSDAVTIASIDIQTTTTADIIAEAVSGDETPTAMGSGVVGVTAIGDFDPLRTTTIPADETIDWNTTSSGESTDAADPCDRFNPCQHGATCYLDQSTGEVGCDCPAGFSGVFCQDRIETEMTETSTLETSTLTASATDSVDIASTEERVEITSGDTTSAPASSDMSAASSVVLTSTVTSRLVETGSGDLLPATTGSEDTKETASGDLLPATIGSEDTKETGSGDGSTTTAPTADVFETTAREAASSGEFEVFSDPCDKYNPCQNGATCYLDESTGEVACSCSLAFSGVFCQNIREKEATEMSTSESSTSADVSTEETASGDVTTSTPSVSVPTASSGDILTITTVADELTQSDLSTTMGSGDTKETSSRHTFTSAPQTMPVDDTSTMEGPSSGEVTVPTDPCDRFNPCQNGGVCYLDENSGEVACNCPDGFSGAICQDTMEADITTKFASESSTPTVSGKPLTDLASSGETSETVSGDIITLTSSGDLETTSLTDATTTATVTEGLDEHTSGDGLSDTQASVSTDETASGFISTAPTSTTQTDETSAWERTSSGESTVSTDPCER